MTIPTKVLLLVGIALLAVIAGFAAGVLAYANGATALASMREAAIGFGASLTLFLAFITVYTLL
ncbi:MULTISPECIES: hypothetical protein [Nocardia]|uniref:Uncharacterized protein n=1 Tax=Nocardia thailandica TaxID=257275 RepID=A0ABW6PWC2_9NOCA|nr:MULTISPECIES: hypothetical protein [Nocardia]